MKSIADIKKEIDKAAKSKPAYIPDLSMLEILKYIQELEGRLEALEGA